MIDDIGEIFVDYESSQMLSELGFDWATRTSYYDGDLYDWVILDFKEKLLAPTIDVAERWLRKIKKILFNFHFDMNKLTYKIIVTEHIIDENTELFLPGMKNPIHFDPNNFFFRGETHEYKDFDDARKDAIKLALKYLTLTKSEYHKYYGNYLKGE